MKLKPAYRDLMRHRINGYVAGSNDAMVLAENFIENEYWAVIQLDDCILLIVENIGNPIYLKLKTKFNESGYLITSKRNLKNNLSEKQFKCIIHRGLNEDLDIGLNSLSDFLVHRMVAAVYYNIIGLQIHHLDKSRTNNYIWNLVPIDGAAHLLMGESDRMEEFDKAIELERALQDEQFRRTNRTKVNDEVIEEILKRKESLWNQRKSSRRCH